MIERVEHQGATYLRVNPQDLDFSQATSVQKITDAYVVQATKKTVVQTELDGHEETGNTAQIGDWIVYNIGNVKVRDIPNHENLSPDALILARAEAAESYAVKADNFDNTYTKEHAINDGFFAKTSSDPRKALTLTFDAVMTAPWGKDMFVKKGGVLISNGGKDIYGIEEHAFAATHGEPNSLAAFDITHKNQLQAGKVMAEIITFTNKDTAVDYAEAAVALDKENGRSR